MSRLLLVGGLLLLLPMLLALLRLYVCSSLQEYYVAYDNLPTYGYSYDYFYGYSYNGTNTYNYDYEYSYNGTYTYDYGYGYGYGYDYSYNGTYAYFPYAYDYDAYFYNSSDACTPSAWVGDAYCDLSLNTAECNWDGGDCCPATCKVEENRLNALSVPFYGPSLPYSEFYSDEGSFDCSRARVWTCWDPSVELKFLEGVCCHSSCELGRQEPRGAPMGGFVLVGFAACAHVWAVCCWLAGCCCCCRFCACMCALRCKNTTLRTIICPRTDTPTTISTATATTARTHTPTTTATTTATTARTPTSHMPTITMPTSTTTLMHALHRHGLAMRTVT